MRHAIRLLKSRKATKAEIADWFKRFRLAGSALSTTRMSLRLCMGIENFGWFLKQLRLYRKNSNYFYLCNL